MKEKSHLSLYGAGPYYAASSAVLTLIVWLLNHFHRLPILTVPSVSWIFKGLSAALLLIAALLWINAVLIRKIDSHILKNELLTEGAYAWVRNPIYCAIMLVMWAVLLWTENLYLLILCPVYHILMAVLVKNTEEKWLRKLYGQKYLDYCKQVNRCIPWFPKNFSK